MPAPSTSDEFLDLIRKSGVLEEKRLDAYLDKARAAGPLPTEASKLAGVLVRHRPGEIDGIAVDDDLAHARAGLVTFDAHCFLSVKIRNRLGLRSAEPSAALHRNSRALRQRDAEIREGAPFSAAAAAAMDGKRRADS